MKLRLFPRDTGFHDLFARQAAIVAEAAAFLATEFREYHDPATASEQLRELKRAGDDVNHETIAHLEKTFVAPFDRTAIHDLATGLDEVLDGIEEVADKLVLYKLAAPPAGADDQAELVTQACRVIVEAIDHLERPTELRRYADNLHRIETEGDALVRELLSAPIRRRDRRPAGVDRPGDGAEHHRDLEFEEVREEPARLPRPPRRRGAHASRRRSADRSQAEEFGETDERAGPTQR